MRLIWILEEIGKETILDEYLLNAKTELQIIRDKINPYLFQISLIASRPEETTEEKLKKLEKHELEDCKNALEKMKEIVHLNSPDENLLKEINDKLKSLKLEEEIEQLKKNKTENSQHQEKNEKEIEEKERELDKIKEGKEKNQKSTIQEITSAKNQILQILKKYKLKNVDLPKKYQNWQERLSKCQNKEQINVLVQEIRQEIIKQKNKNLKQIQNRKDNKSQSLSPNTKIGIGIGIGCLILLAIGVGLLVTKRRKKQKRIR